MDGWPCCPAVRSIRRRDSGRYGTHSTGVISCSRRPTSSCCVACPCSGAARASMQSYGCAGAPQGAALVAVVGVCGRPDGGSVGVLDSVDGLRRNSLLIREEVGAGETRLRLLETVREYGLEQLGASPGEEVGAKNQHAGYYADLAVDLAYRVQGPDQVQALGRLEQEHDNIRAALRWWPQTHDAH